MEIFKKGTRLKDLENKMVKKRIKATLSFDAEIYRNFQEYCNENAIMLSRTIEIFMKDFFKKKKKKLNLVIFLIGIFFMIPNFASAITIALDDFECGGFNCGSGWNGAWSSSGDCIVTSLDTPRGGFHMRGQEDATGTCIVDRNFDNVGYDYSNISFWAKSNVLENGDFCRYYYYNGFSYFLLLEMTNGDDDDIYKNYSYDILSYGLSSNAGIRMRQFGVGSDNCYIDDVNIYGFSSSGSDTTKPVVNLLNPLNNTTINNNLSYFIASFNDNVNVSNATLYVWNSTSLVGTNFTKLGNSSISSNLSFTLPREGRYFWNYLAYDNSSNFAFNNTNFTLIFSLPDTIAPNWGNALETPTDPATYVSNQNYQFNVTWSDDSGIDNVFIEHNFTGSFTNYNVTNLSSVYTYNISNLPAGSYSWRMHANDSVGNTNQTDFFSYTINKASSNVNLTLNGIDGNVTVQVESTINLTGYKLTGEGIIRLYNNNNLINQGNGPLENLTFFNSLGTFNITIIYEDTQNFTQRARTNYLIVQDTIVPNLTVNSPINAYNSSVRNLIFNATARDNFNLTNISFWANFSGSFVINQTNTIGVNGDYLFNVTIQDGGYIWAVQACDGSNNCNITANRTLMIDSAFPLIDYGFGTEADGTTSRKNNIYVNVSVTELNEINISFRLYNNTGPYNETTFTNKQRTINWTILQDGIYYYNVSVFDIVGNYNFTETRAITLDTSVPLYYNLTETPQDPAIYSPGQRYEFNSTWSDSYLDKVFIEFNGINYSSSNTGNVYNFSINDLASGIYSYYWHANDSLGNRNLTPIQTYTINNATGNVSLFLNGAATNQTLVYGTQINASAYTLFGSISLSRDGININSENGLNVILGRGDYNYTASSSGDQNHSSTLLARFVHINRAQSLVNLTLNRTEWNITIFVNSTILLNGSLMIGGGGILRLYNNGSLINEGVREVSNQTTFANVGIFNISVIYEGDNNHTESSETWYVDVISAALNFPPTINSNHTIVNQTIKMPVYGDNFYIRVNISDAEDFVEFVNFSLVSPNGSIVVNNKKGINYSVGGDLIWEGENYTVDDYGYWNWSYVLFDGLNFVQNNGTFRVLSDLSVFPSSYISTPDPKNQTLTWNLSLYHLSNEEYNFSFSYALNSTYFNLTFANTNSVLSKKIYNDSNLFNNQVTIVISDNILENKTYEGNITITRILDGKNYIVPLNIGINPPSGNIDAFDLNNIECSRTSCNIDATMENDESKTFSWILRNIGNNSLRDCKPNITGFDISSFGSFSNNNFNLNMGESITLSLTINRPSINSYYGQLETTCKATSSGFINSLGAEGDNAPRIKLLVLADSGDIVSPPGGGGSGGGGGGGGAILIKPINITKTIKMELLFIEDIILKKGTNGNARLQVINTGNIFLNNCKLKFSGYITYWLSNSQIKGLAVGEKFIYGINIDVPDEGNTGEYFSDVGVECDEGKEKIELKVNAYRNAFNGEIGEYERSGGNLIVNYILREYSGENHDISLFYEMKDLDNVTRFKGQANTTLLKKEEKTEKVEFKLPKDSFGEFYLVFEMNDGISTISKEKKIFLPSSSLGTGLIISEGGNRAKFAIILITSLVLLFFVLKFIHGHHKKIRKLGKLGKRDKRKFIKLEM